MINEPKFCINCKHHYDVLIIEGESPNHCCKLYEISSYDLVTGRQLVDTYPCEAARKDNAKCTVQAKYFEPKD